VLSGHVARLGRARQPLSPECRTTLITYYY
jgi:hypothetical protein